MAEQYTKPESEAPGGETCGRHRDGRFSLGLFVTGLLALLVSVWAMAGLDSWAFASMIPIGWIIVAVAIVVGLVLVIAPRKRR